VGTPPPRPGPEEESLRRRLAGALARFPVPGVAPPAADWELPADTAELDLAGTRAEFLQSRWYAGSEAWAVAEFVRLAREAVDQLRTPRSDTWEVELVARRRIRRWARWEITGAEAAEQVVATVLSGVRAGRVPEPWGAILVDVVDQRPLPRPVH
jgi:hypothetical protein